MSTAEAANRPVKSRRAAKLWLAFLIVIVAGIGLAWVGVQSVKDRVVQVQTLQAGSGPFVQAPDGVLIEYEGRLENGTVFDSTAGKGPVPLLASQVIPGFTQGLLKMQKGGRYKLRIPPELAYGATPPPGGPIPPNADLEFGVHVVDVAPNAALMQSGGAPPQQ